MLVTSYKSLQSFTNLVSILEQLKYVVVDFTNILNVGKVNAHWMVVCYVHVKRFWHVNCRMSNFLCLYKSKWYNMSNLQTAPVQQLFVHVNELLILPMIIINTIDFVVNIHSEGNTI